MPAVFPASSAVISATQTNAQQKGALGGMADALAERVNSFTTTGTATALVGTPSPAVTSYFEGLSFMVRFHVASGAAPTLAISGIATPPALVKENFDGTYSNVAAGDIPAGHRSRVTLISATQALVERLPQLQVGPAFSAYQSSAQSIGTGVNTKVFFQSEDFDTAARFGLNTFQPFTPGYYQVNWSVAVATGAPNLLGMIFKNGSRLRDGSFVAATSFVSSGSALVYMNGTTDFLDVYAYHTLGSAATMGTGTGTAFSGALVGAA